MMKWLKTLLANNRDYRRLAAIKSAVDARITYGNAHKNEWRYVPKGSKSIGDCQVYAETYKRDCQEEAGYNADTHVFQLGDGTYHAVCEVYTATATWQLDNQYKRPRKV